MHNSLNILSFFPDYNSVSEEHYSMPSNSYGTKLVSTSACMHIYKQYFTLIDERMHSKVAVKYACGFNWLFSLFFHVQCCWPFQLSAGRFVKLCDKMTPKSSAVNCLFGPMVSNESVWISSAGVSLFGCRSGEQCQSLSLANGVQCMVWWWRVSESVFGQWRAMNGLMVKSVRICLWPMACNEWSDGEECQSVPLANGVQCMVWWWRVSVCPFGQWHAMNGLMVKTVSLSLANSVQWMVW